MRRRPAAVHSNHERWLVSYADFITLLFAFFVVMFSTQADKTKIKAVSDSVRDAMEHGQVSAAIAAALGRGKHPGGQSAAGQPEIQPADLAKSLDTLQHGLDGELKAGKVQLKLEPRGLVISLREAAFFASGDDAVAPPSVPILAKIAAVVQGVPNPVRLEGHTDSVPIHNSRFRSNWELSAARGIAMLELLRVRFQIAPERMAVAGYAENAPADTNDTEDGRAHNRRVDMVLLTQEGQRSEPAAAAPAGPTNTTSKKP